jgi:hypothetical protein
VYLGRLLKPPRLADMLFVLLFEIVVWRFRRIARRVKPEALTAFVCTLRDT